MKIFTFNPSTNAQKWKLVKYTFGSGTQSSSNGIPAGVKINDSYNISVSGKSRPNNPHYTNSTGNRSKEAYNLIIDQFNVESNTRYKRTATQTFCNIFSWDVTSAMNAEIPHWLLNKKYPSTFNNGSEIGANATLDWLKDYGAIYGWRKVNAEQAQRRANSGYPTVVVGSGHIAIVRPEGNGYDNNDKRGPVIAQAGGKNFNYGNVSTGWSSSKMTNLSYFTHD